MIIQFSPFANNVIQKYKQSLMLPKYHCTEERANEKAQEMVDYIIGKVSDTTIELQECPYVELGKKNGAKGDAFNKRLKWFQYKVSANNSWRVSVLYDENGNALVYRIVHSSYIKKEPVGQKQQPNASQQDKQKAKESSKWIPLQDFNKQIQEENIMKFKRYIKESDMSRRESIKQTMQDRRTRKHSVKVIYDDIMKLKPRISDMVETINEVENEYGTDSSHFLWEDWFTKWYNEANDDKFVCIPYDDFLFGIYSSGECFIYHKKSGWDAWDFQWYQDIKSAKELNYGEIYNDELEDEQWESWGIFMKNFDKIENAFYDFVEKKLNED